MTITLPLPTRNLSPNARCHWAVKAREVKVYRALAHWRATKEMQRDLASRGAVFGAVLPMRLDRATVRLTFYWPDKRRRDRDNALASMKSAMDGFTDAGVWGDDSGVTFLPIAFEVDRASPRVEVEVTPL